MGDTEPPPIEAVPGQPPTLPAASPTGTIFSSATGPKRRGPKPGHETAVRVAEIIATVAVDDDWKGRVRTEWNTSRSLVAGDRVRGGSTSSIRGASHYVYATQPRQAIPT